MADFIHQRFITKDGISLKMQPSLTIGNAISRNSQFVLLIVPLIYLPLIYSPFVLIIVHLTYMFCYINIISIHTPWIEYTGPCCVRFQYLMTGFDVESLTLYKESKTGRGLIELWIETDTTSGWKEASLDLKLQGKFKVTVCLVC